ncbi:MAG: hypothetical protein ACRDHJ_12545, partial [Actinomycetota bacterium]
MRTTDGRRRAVPLTARLGFTYALLVAATLLVVAAVATQLTSAHLASLLDDRLLTVVDSFRRGPASRATDADRLVEETRQWLSETGFPEEEVVAVRVGQEVLRSSGGLDLGSIDGVDDVLLSVEPRWWDLEASVGSVRALTTPVVVDGDAVGTLAVGASFASQTATL